MAKLIAITGNTGKSSFSFYLSATLSKKYKVALVSTDGQLPAYPMLFPTMEQNPKKSLGRLLSLAAITEADILNHAVILADELVMLSYAQGESKTNYPEITEINLHNLFAQLDRLVDCVIVDTSTRGNLIDTFAITRAVEEICLSSADNKGFAYRQYYKPEHATQVLLNNNPHNPLSDVLQTFSEPVRILAYCRSFGSLYNGVNISDIVPSRRYRKTLYKIVGDLI
jgi:hypothetical protein